MNEKNNNWLVKSPAKSAVPALRVVCFPFAGGGTSNYIKWRADLDERIELCAINLPGRERLFGKPFVSDYQDLVVRLAALLAEQEDCPTVFFGHSFGGLTAYFTALELNKIRPDVPVHLYVSARGNPQFGVFETISGLESGEFKTIVLERYRGIPQVILDSPDMLSIFLPIIQKDFALYEQYPQVFAAFSEKQVNCDLTSIGYASDRVPEEDFQLWKHFTKKTHQHIQLPGGHFEILNNWKPVIELLNQWVIK